jgi:uncharacterized protein DUF3618
MSTSEQLEREAEQTRAEIASMLEELRSRMTPGQIVDQILDFARDSTGGQFFNNLHRQVADNPIPVTLMGAGLAWLVLAGRNGSRRALMSEQRRSVSDSDYGPEESGDYYGTTGLYGRDMEDKAEGEGIATRAQETAGGVMERAREVGSRVSETAGSIGSSVANAASSASSSVADAAISVAGATNAALEASASRARRTAELIGNSGPALRNNMVAASRSIGNFLQEQPLVLAGAGLAIGAALGAMFPTTRTENELMGEASDSFKKRAKEVAEEQIAKGREFAGRVWDDAKQEANKMGFSSSGYAQPVDRPGMLGENMHRGVQEGEFSAGERDEPRQVSSNASFEGEKEPSSREEFERP